VAKEVKIDNCKMKNECICGRKLDFSIFSLQETFSMNLLFRRVTIFRKSPFSLAFKIFVRQGDRIIRPPNDARSLSQSLPSVEADQGEARQPWE